MNVFGAKLESAEQLQALIAARIPEDRTIEYKRDLPSDSRDDRAEFLRDVVSFCNSSGGVIIYGMESQDGLPVRLSGFPTANCDASILKLEQIIRSGIEPPIFGLLVRSIPLLPANTCAIIIEIPQGVFGPHMIKNRGAFYTRSSAGKVAMELPEIRSAFVGAESLAARMREFRGERIARLLANDGFPKMGGGPSLLVLHVLPFASFGSANLAGSTGGRSERRKHSRSDARFRKQPRFHFRRIRENRLHFQSRAGRESRDQLLDAFPQWLHRSGRKQFFKSPHTRNSLSYF
jgi:Schlafen, AlbA_2